MEVGREIQMIIFQKGTDGMSHLPSSKGAIVLGMDILWHDKLLP